MGQGATHKPAFVVLSHTPDGASRTIAWVGKGVVYDTGGLSMKGKVLVIRSSGNDPYINLSFRLI